MKAIRPERQLGHAHRLSTIGVVAASGGISMLADSARRVRVDPNYFTQFEDVVSQHRKVSKQRRPSTEVGGLPIVTFDVRLVLCLHGSDASAIYATENEGKNASMVAKLSSVDDCCSLSCESATVRRSCDRACYKSVSGVSGCRAS